MAVGRWDAVSVVRQKIKVDKDPEGNAKWNEFKTAMKVFYRKQNFDQNVAWDDHDFPKRREAIEEGCRRYYEINGNKSLFGDINVESLVLWKLHDLHSSRYRNLRLKSGKQKLTQTVDSNHQPSTEPEECINQPQPLERRGGKRFDPIREVWVESDR